MKDRPNVELMKLYGHLIALDTKASRYFIKLASGKFRECLKPISKWVLLK